MLIEDWPLRRISGALAMDEGALAGHLESIQHKLAARTRDVATLRALRCGLYVPLPSSPASPGDLSRAHAGGNASAILPIDGVGWS